MTILVMHGKVHFHDNKKHGGRVDKWERGKGGVKKKKKTGCGQLSQEDILDHTVWLGQWEVCVIEFSMVNGEG